MQIPFRLKELLAKKSALMSGVMLSFDEFEPWLKASGVPFFPEYTDHGLDHIEGVLRTVDALTSDESRKTITPGDAAVLILATLLHDMAMHLSEDGFVELVRPDSRWEVIDGFNDKRWHLLWEDFITEARRFDGHRLMELFGDTEPVYPPELDPQKMTKRDRMLIGEFLRRYHHRLAHEIALWGIPGPEDNRLRLKEIQKDIVDLAGIVARSHGVQVRACFDYLKKYDLREYKGVHAVFLMTLLRVSDYLQIQSERAPKQVLRVRAIRSPISRGEWNAHHAIRDIRNTHEDPEAIFIDARPPGLEEYLKIKNWLTNMQSELDASWAVLGEVYGRYKGLDQLGLAVRRVRSNLDDDASFAKTVHYVPARAAFEAADVDLLKLLIKPLYGDCPEIGTRELVQNAVDAVLELREYQRRNPDALDADVISQKADVIISIDEESDGSYYVTVSDKGIGMTAEVIREYYLRVGASFRESDAWRKHFEDEEGRSCVLRSGRFGIGVLSGFLLGKEIHISTRHVGAQPDEGIEFSATLESRATELRYINRPVGTTVRIKIDDSTKEKLEKTEWRRGGFTDEHELWDWYCLKEPRVLRMLSKGKRTLVQKYKLPAYGTDLAAGWHRIHHPDYNDIHWTYLKAPHLSCNGIIIMKDYEYPFPKLMPERLYFTLEMPKISVFDPDGKLPLNLQRNKLTQNVFPFNKQLLEDVLRDLAAFILVHAPTKGAYHDIKYPGLESFRWKEFSIDPLLFTLGGISFADCWSISELGIQSILIAPRQKGGKWLPNSIPRSIDAILNCCLRPTKGALKDWVRFVVDFIRNYYGNCGHEPVAQLRVHGTHLLLDHSVANDLMHYGKLPKSITSKIKKEWENKDFVLWRIGKVGSTKLDFNDLAQYISKNHPVNWLGAGLAVWYLKDKQPNPETTPLVRMWRDMIGSPCIPYDLAERHRKLAKAYKTLESYIRAHKVQAKSKEKKAHNES